MIFADTKTGEVFEEETRTPRSGPKRGGFDPDGNAWFGGTGGAAHVARRWRRTSFPNTDRRRRA